MNILLASREWPGVNPSGGIGVYMENWARDLKALGHDVEVMTMAPPGSLAVDSDGEQIGLVVPDEHFEDGVLGYSYALAQAIERRTARKPFGLIEFPDYLGEGYFTVKNKRLRGLHAATTLRVHSHMSLSLCDRLNREVPDLARTSVYETERYAMAYCDVLSAPSQDLARLYREELGRDVVVTRHPLPIFGEGAYTPPPTSRRAVILYVGRLEYRKGVDLLLDAVFALWQGGEDGELWLAGEDTIYRARSFREQLESRVPGPWRERVRFLGQVERSALRPLFETAAVVVFPSRFENWPNVCLEAMSLGCAVVASKFGGMREMLEGGAGVLINPEHQPSFTMALAAVLSDHGVAKDLGEQAQRAVQGLSGEPQEVLRLVAPSRRDPKPENALDALRLTVVRRVGSLSAVWMDDLNRLASDRAVSQVILELPQPMEDIIEDITSPLPPHVEVVGSAQLWDAVRGEVVCWLEAGEAFVPGYLSEALECLQRLPALSAVYPMLEGASSQKWTVLGEAAPHGVLNPLWRRVRPLMRVADAPRAGAFELGRWPCWEQVIDLVESGMAAELYPAVGIYAAVLPAWPQSRELHALWHDHPALLGPGGYEALVANDGEWGQRVERGGIAGRLVRTPVGKMLLRWARRLSPGTRASLKRLVRQMKKRGQPE